jgi:hypothetical protein
VPSLPITFPTNIAYAFLVLPPLHVHHCFSYAFQQSCESCMNHEYVTFGLHYSFHLSLVRFRCFPLDFPDTCMLRAFLTVKRKCLVILEKSFTVYAERNLAEFKLFVTVVSLHTPEINSQHIASVKVILNLYILYHCHPHGYVYVKL